MKNFIITNIALIAFACSTTSQLVELQTNNNHIKEDNYIHTDSIVTIQYDFYSRNGVVKFTIINNTSKPLYIDWKNSSLIISKNQIYQYWEDESLLQGTESHYTGNFYGNIYKRDRITFLPPNTEYTNTQFCLANNQLYNIGIADIKQVSKNWTTLTGKTKILTKSYTFENTPLKFRNYLTISTTEDFRNPIHYDFQFWISNIQQMNSKQLVANDPGYYYLDSINNPKYHPYKQKNRYFIIKE